MEHESTMASAGGFIGLYFPSPHPRPNAPMSPKPLARLSGVLYLFVGISGGFAEGYVDPKLYVAGDAAATAANVVSHAGLVRLGVVES